MNIKSNRFFVTSVVMSVVVASAVIAIYVSAVSNTAASTPVSPLDLSSPMMVQAALEFDPFGSGNAASEADLGQDSGGTFAADAPSPDPGVAPAGIDDASPASADLQPADTPTGVEENAPELEQSGEDVVAAGEAKAMDSGQATTQKGAIKAGKTTGKMKLGVGAAIVGGVAALGVGGVALGVALDDDSKTVVRSPSKP